MEYKTIDLQLFADGGAGAAGGDGGAAAGAGDAAGVTAPDAGVNRAKKRRENPLASVKYGKQPEPVAPSPDATGAAEAADTTGDAGDAGKKPSFQELIEGDYKAEFGEYVQNIIRQRFKANAENEEKLGKMTPIMEMLGQKYDIDPNDIDGIAKVVGDDDSLYEAEAMERGMSIDSLKAIKQMERENAQLKQREQLVVQQGGSIRVERKIPKMDYVCEANNRLWGCFYGMAAIFDSYRIETTGYIKRGIIGFDDENYPIFGIAIGQELKHKEVTVGGEVYEVFDERQNMATYAADKLSFWVNGVQVAYLSNSELVVTRIIVSDSIQLTSAADSLANAALFGGGAAISMSFGAFDSSYQAGLESGKPLFDNLVDSTVDGAIEALTEYVSVEALFSDTLNPIGYLAKNVFSEASEEVTGDVLRLGYDVWAHGEANAINARIDELRVMGYDPQVARRQAIQEWVSGLGETAVTSAFSGGVSALPGATTSYAENRSTGKALQENAGETGYQSLIDLAGTVELSKSGQKILDELRGLAAQRQVVPETEVTQKEGIEYPGQQAQEQVVPETEVAQKEAVEYPGQQAQKQVVTEAEVAQKEAVEYPGQQTVSKPGVSKSKLGQLYREVAQKLDEKAQDVLREFMSFDLAKELRQRGLPAQEAKDLAGSVLRIQDGSFTEADVRAVSGSTEARDALSAWTALAGAVDKAKGALGELAGMLEKKDSTNAETETGEEPVSMEAVQPEDEFDVQAAEVQAEAENLLSSGGEASTLDGEEIEVLGVAPAEGAESDGAPRVRIRTADGTERSVAAKDIAYGAKDAGVYQLAAYAGKYGRNADQMFNLRLSGQDVTEYARAFSKAAQVGSDGRNLSLLMNSGEIDALTPGQAQAAYDIGRAARAQRSQAQQEALGAKGANVQVGRLDVSQIERVSLNKQQRASVDAMGKLAKALGINVRFVESKADESGRYTTENGSYDPNTRTLTLDIHAGSNFIKDTRYAVMNTAGHELTHYIRQFADSALWDGYQDFVMDHLCRSRLRHWTKLK